MGKQKLIKITTKCCKDGLHSSRISVKLEKLYDPILSQCCIFFLSEDTILLTTKSLGVPNTHLVYLGGMKG